MNDHDVGAALQFLETQIAQSPEAAVIAFSVSELAKRMRNIATTRRTERFVETLNDVLSVTEVCKRLGSVYTLASYGEGVLFLIAGHKVVSHTALYDPQSKVFAKKESTSTQFEVGTEVVLLPRAAPIPPTSGGEYFITEVLQSEEGDFWYRVNGWGINFKHRELAFVAAPTPESLQLVEAILAEKLRLRK